MHDIKKQPYDCEFYKQTVLVHIKRDICDKGEYCPEPQPHITGEHFYTCSDILHCGVGKLVDGRLVVPHINLCPAHLQLDIRGETL
ncbi:MAG: hypothetical protein M3388_18495 [Acidobacteriota bacterium]|nr:hypothetical protein [Acidobacteriota bacterium]